MVRTPAAALLACAALLASSPIAAREDPSLAKVEVAFTPGDDVAGLIVERIGLARRSVQMQAYLLTDRRIANALIAARRRGVAVQVIGDAAQRQAGGMPHLKALERAGASIYLDGTLAAAHNKIVIVDGTLAAATVITGSFNFTQAAQAKNAENVVVISGNRAVTDRFVDNFERQRGRSMRWP